MLKSAYLIGIVILLYAGNAYPQTTKFQLQVDFGKSVDDVGNAVNTYDGGYLVCGKLQDAAGAYPFLVKVTSWGQIEWKEIYETNSIPSSGKYVIQTADGGFMLVGELEIDSINKDILVIRTDSIGNPLWTKTYGNSFVDSGNNIVQLPSGNFLIIGESTLAGVKHGIFIRINPNGDVLETNYLDATYGATNVKGKLIGSNQIIVTGTAITEIFTDTSGIYQGQSFIRNDNMETTVEAIITTTGSHVSLSNIYLGFPSAGDRFILTKADSAGALTPDWVTTYQSFNGPSHSTSLISALNGNFIVTGNALPIFGSGSLFLAEIDTNGNNVWHKTYYPGNSMDFRPGGSVATPDSGYLVVSAGYVPSGKYDLMIIKTDSVGSSGCNEIDFWLFNQATGGYNTPSQISGNSGSILNAGTLASITSSSYGTLTQHCYTSDENMDQFSASTVNFHPNPFKNYLTCEIPGSIDGPFNLTIYDMLGAVKANLTSPKPQWSGSELEMLPAGIYLVKLQIPGMKGIYARLLHY